MKKRKSSSEQQTTRTKKRAGTLTGIETVSFREAAKGQLEQAIWLWFYQDNKFVVVDLASIHTLAVAAQGVLAAVCRNVGHKPTPLMQAMANVESLRHPQNFFKHGNYSKKGKRSFVKHWPTITETILADCVGIYGVLFGASTPLLETYLFRYSLWFSGCGIRLKTLEMKFVELGANLDSLAALDREDFLKTVTPYLSAWRRVIRD